MRDPFAVLVPGGVAVTIFAFALGSSSVAALDDAGRTIRWVALFALLGVAAWAARGLAEPMLPGAVLVAAGAFVGLAVLSSLWSVDPRLSFARAASVGVLFAVAGLLAVGSVERPRAAERVLLGALAGAAGVAVAGLVLLAVAPSTAVIDATIGVPARFTGLGENPNTAALLLSVALPLAVWLALERSRPVGIALALLFAGSIAASGSRGAIVAALAGTLVVIALAAGTGRRGAVLAVMATAVATAAVATGTIPDPADPEPAPAGAPAERPRYQDAQAVFPLEDDVGRPLPGRGQVERPRELFGSSGRVQVWGEALDLAARRPVAGYGFGTEDQVFVDRYANFAGGMPENSYIGLLLQLGAAGLASLALLVAAIGVTGRRALRWEPVAAACAGVVTAGLVAAVVQSYLYSVGNVATATFWIAAFLLAAAGTAQRRAARPALSSAGA